MDFVAPRRNVLLVLALQALLAGCTSLPPAPLARVRVLPPRSEDPQTPTPHVSPEAAIPVDPENPSRGAKDAWVTVVVFAEFRSFFMVRHLLDAQDGLERDAVRLVLKVPSEGKLNEALVGAAQCSDFDKMAAYQLRLMKALVGGEAREARRAAGDVRGPRELAEDVDVLVAEAEPLGAELATCLREGLRSGRWAAVLSRDREAARRAGAPDGVYVNGVRFDLFFDSAALSKTIAAEIDATRQLLASGVPRADLYAVRSMQNKTVLAGRNFESDLDTKRRQRVAIESAPSEGPEDALVTVVGFVDLSSPDCASGGGALEAMRSAARGRERDVRVVARLVPPDDPKADTWREMLALEARKERGDAGYFGALQALCDLESPGRTWRELGTTLGLDATKLSRAVSEKSHRRALEAERAFMDALAADRGTIFVNGRRVEGGRREQWLDKSGRAYLFWDEAFRRVLLEELNAARQRVRGGRRRADSYEDALRLAE